MARRTFPLAVTTALALALSQAAVAQGADLDQGWTDDDRTRWYGASQGSRLLPLDWFMALEQASGTVLFADPAHLAGFRYLERPAGDPLRPLPIGFVVDATDDTNLSVTRLRWKAGQGSREKWVGLNCSACHTSRLTRGAAVLQVDGGTTLADFQSFFEALNAALVATRDDAAKLARFSDRVLGAGAGAADRDLLKTAFGKLVAFQEDLAEMNRADVRYGFARLDAFGFIFNKVSRVVNGDAGSGNPSDAPVSYPFIWNVPQHDRVQWNGIAENRVITDAGQPLDVGALGRNSGEVIGVFADVVPSDDFPKGLSLGGGFASSVDVANLVALEQQLGRLRPPKWPDAALGAIDPALRTRGRALFDQHCVGCHAHLDRTDLRTPIRAVMTRLANVDHPIGTDPWMACNAYTYAAGSGVLEGARNKFFTGDALESPAYLSDLLTVSVSGVLWKQKGQIVQIAAASLFGRHRPPQVTPLGSVFRRTVDAVLGRAPSKADRLDKCMTDDSELLAYKGRPLNGIWATPPYLHNGSVATLYDLLLPPAQRPKSFLVGTREFDPAHVGYLTDATAPGNSFEFRVVDSGGAPIEGNSNDGHDYGSAGFGEADRLALVEYMKSL
jgi:cytochrome c peroxidase